MARKIKEYYASVKSDDKGTYLSIPIMSKGKEYEIQIDTVDYERFRQYNWNVLYTKNKASYIKRYVKRVEGVSYIQTLHHYITGMGSEVSLDHIDGNGFNNRRGNVRIATSQQNSQNRKPRRNASSKYKGVSWCRRDKLWLARIKYRGEELSIGRFRVEKINGEDEGEKRAARAYDDAAILYFGSYAKLNFPDERNFISLNGEHFKTEHLLCEKEEREAKELIKKLKWQKKDDLEATLSMLTVEELQLLCHYYGCGVDKLPEEIEQGLLSETVAV